MAEERAEEGRVVDISRALSQRKIQFYKNIGLVMRNSRWVSAVAGKNLKRAEEGQVSFSASYVQAPLRPTPSVPERKINPTEFLYPSFSFCSIEISPPDPLFFFTAAFLFSRLSEFCEANEIKRRLFGDDDRYYIDSQLRLNQFWHSHSCLSRVNLEFRTIYCEY